MTVRTRLRHAVVALCSAFAAAGAAAAQADPPQSPSAPNGAADPYSNVVHVADLGTCETTAGDVVRDCHLAYRTYGRLNDARDNVVLIPSWYGGTSEQLLRLLGDAGVVDTTHYFAVLVDALGNGVSTSPSTSITQPAGAFPVLAIADMVIAQHRLVREHLRLPGLHAVVGYSMGAMQALEWATRFPGEARRIVSLLGTPRATTHDVVTWRTLCRLVDHAAQQSNRGDSAWIPLAEYWHVIRATPGRVNAISTERLDQELLAQAASWRAFDAHDNRLQLEAMLRHDVSAPFDGDLRRAAAAVTAELLVVVSPDDRVVGSGAALQFGELSRAEVMTVPSECGHFALYCAPDIAARARTFLARPLESDKK